MNQFFFVHNNFNYTLILINNKKQEQPWTANEHEFGINSLLHHQNLIMNAIYTQRLPVAGDYRVSVSFSSPALFCLLFKDLLPCSVTRDFAKNFCAKERQKNKTKQRQNIIILFYEYFHKNQIIITLLAQVTLIDLWWVGFIIGSKCNESCMISAN